MRIKLPAPLRRLGQRGGDVAACRGEIDASPVSMHSGEAPAATWVANLPTELWGEVLAALPRRDRLALGSTCRELQAVLHGQMQLDAGKLWHRPLRSLAAPVARAGNTAVMPNAWPTSSASHPATVSSGGQTPRANHPATVSSGGQMARANNMMTMLSARRVARSCDATTTSSIGRMARSRNTTPTSGVAPMSRSCDSTTIWSAPHESPEAGPPQCFESAVLPAPAGAVQEDVRALVRERWAAEEALSLGKATPLPTAQMNLIRFNLDGSDREIVRAAPFLMATGLIPEGQFCHAKSAAATRVACRQMAAAMRNGSLAAVQLAVQSPRVTREGLENRLGVARDAGQSNVVAWLERRLSIRDT